MEIAKDLRLVIPVDTEHGESFVHAQAVGRETFDRYFVVISQAFSNVYTDGVSRLTGPRVAARYIRMAAEARGPGVLDDINAGLFGEIIRLANVALRGKDGPVGPADENGVVPMAPAGWQMVPLADAFRDGLLDEDTKDEVENALAFFTLISCVHKRKDRAAILEYPIQLWGGRLTSSSYTEFVASLPTSTATASSGARAPVSSAIY